MAFKSYEELIKMASTNPKQAQSFVQKAQNTGKPVVSDSNPGYNKKDSRLAALKRQANKVQPSQPPDAVVQNRKEAYY